MSIRLEDTVFKQADPGAPGGYLRIMGNYQYSLVFIRQDLLEVIHYQFAVHAVQWPVGSIVPCFPEYWAIL